jgi:hypothetical protein
VLKAHGIIAGTDYSPATRLECNEALMSAHSLLLTGTILAGSLLACAAEAKPKESAQALLNRGNKAFAAGDYAAALEAFEKGYELSPSPVFLRSIGYAYLKMYKHEKARATLQEYLKKYPNQPDAKKIKDLVDGLDVVVQTKVSITSSPPGADLYFDTEAAGKVATTPFDGTIEPGKHLVILKLGSYHVTVRPFTIAPKQSLKLEIPMEAPLKVSSVPEGADVFIDGQKTSVGKTPLTASIAPGKHKITIRLAGYKTWVEPVEVKPPAPVSLAATLGLGIRVTSTPPGARVELDGRPLDGVTPLEESVTPGEHKVTVSLPGYKPFTQTARVAAGSDNLVDARLEGGLLTMRTDIPGATISVDGQQVGSTPTERATVPLGRHEVKVSHPDRRSWSSAVEFEDGHMIDAEVKLGGPSWPLWVAGAATGAGIVLASVGGGLMLKARNDPNNVFKPDGTCNVVGMCDYKYHHMTTAGFVIGGTALAAGILYYVNWGRPRAEVRKLPVSTASPSTRSPKRTAAVAGY